MHSLGLVKTRIDQGLDYGTKIRLFPDTTTFFKVFCFSRHFPDLPTYHKIPDFFPISRPGGDPVEAKCVDQNLVPSREENPINKKRKWNIKTPSWNEIDLTSSETVMVADE